MGSNDNLPHGATLCRQEYVVKIQVSLMFLVTAYHVYKAQIASVQSFAEENRPAKPHMCLWHGCSIILGAIPMEIQGRQLEPWLFQMKSRNEGWSSETHRWQWPSHLACPWSSWLVQQVKQGRLQCSVTQAVRCSDQNCALVLISHSPLTCHFDQPKTQDWFEEID